MLGLHRSTAEIERRADESVDPQHLESKKAPDVVNNEIRRSNLMEMHLFDRDLMDSAFCLAERLKYGRGILFYTLGQRRGVDHFQNMRQVPVLTGLDDLHLKLGRADAAALHLVKAQGRAGSE